MSIWHWQIAVIVLGVAGSMVALFRNRIIWSKIIVGMSLTLLAVLQMGVTPLEKKVRRLESRLAVMNEDDPFRPKAEKDLHAALLSLDPVRAYQEEISKLEKTLAEMEKTDAGATAIAGVKEQLARARTNLEKARDPVAWHQNHRIEIEKRIKDLETKGVPTNDPAYMQAQKELSKVKENLAHARIPKRSWKQRLPVNLGLDLSGGTEIRLRLKPDLTRLQGWQAELKKIKKALNELQQKQDPRDREQIIKLQKQQKEFADKIKTSERSLKDEFDNAVEILRTRLNNSGLAEIPVMRQGMDQVLIQLPGMDSGRAQQILETVQRQGKLEFRIVISEQDNKEAYEKVREYIQAHPELKGKEIHNFCLDGERVLKPAEIEIEREGDDGERWKCKIHQSQLVDYLRTPDETKGGKVTRPGQWLLVQKEVLVKGDHIIRAHAEANPMQPGRFLIRVTLDNVGGVLMETVTSQYLKKRMALVLDGKLKSAPTIQGRFSHNFEITGDFDQSEGEQLEVVLKSGSLKVVPQVEFENTVGPTLGEDSIRRGLQSMVAGVLLVIVFMLIYYLVAGMVTDVILMVNLVLIVAILSSFDATLTLPGIAGMILTVGMAVDANVLIFERIREERTRGNSLARSIQLGYERAFVTIVDANVTTFITAVILHSFGTEAVRGFAVTLIIGILCSVFCSLVLTRWVFETLLEYKIINDLKMLLMFKRPAINFIRMRRPAMAVSLILIIVGLSIVVYRGERNLGPDFTGGTIAQISLSQPMSMADARSRVRTMPGFEEVADSMQSFGTDKEGKFTEFVLRLKPESKKEGSVTDKQSKKIADDFRAAIRKAFPTLQPEGVVVGPRQDDRCTPETAFYTVTLTLKDAMSPRYVQQLLTNQGGLVDPEVVKAGEKLPAVPRSKQAMLTLFIDRKAIRDLTVKPAVKPDPKVAEKKNESGGKAPDNKDNKDNKTVADKKNPGAATGKDRKADAAATAEAKAKAAEAEARAKAEAEKKAWLAIFRQACADLGKDILDLEAGVGDPVKEAAMDTPAGMIRVRLPISLKRPVSEWELKQLFKRELPGIGGVVVSLVNPSAPSFTPDDTPGRVLTVLCGVPLKDENGEPRDLAGNQIQFIRDQFQNLRTSGALDFTAPFPRFINVGPTVAGEMGTNALMAMIYAMVAIFFYIWLRFQFRAAFGLGAVVALIHDVLITLGALALVDELGIVNGQIDLVIVAALLTIVGYSLNDTIVVFDRIRENLHGGGRALEEVINSSINQTLSRTVITSATTMLVVLALLVWGGDVIQGFAFSLFVGIMVGTYSSIFIASPILVEFAHLYAKHQQRKRDKALGNK